MLFTKPKSIEKQTQQKAADRGWVEHAWCRSSAYIDKLLLTHLQGGVTERVSNGGHTQRDGWKGIRGRWMEGHRREEAQRSIGLIGTSGASVRSNGTLGMWSRGPVGAMNLELSNEVVVTVL